jgi:hypothetical protein
MYLATVDRATSIPSFSSSHECRECRSRIARRDAWAEGSLQRAQRFVARQALDGDDAGTLSLHRQHQTGADRGAVDDDRARAAGAMLAAEMSSSQAQHVAQAIGEVEAQLDVDRDGFPVDPETHPHHALPC